MPAATLCDVPCEAMTFDMDLGLEPTVTPPSTRPSSATAQSAARSLQTPTRPTVHLAMHHLEERTSLSLQTLVSRSPPLSTATIETPAELHAQNESRCVVNPALKVVGFSAPALAVGFAGTAAI